MMSVGVTRMRGTLTPDRTANFRAVFITLAVVAFTCLDSTDASAQDLEPRAFSNAPVGLNFLIAGYIYET